MHVILRNVSGQRIEGILLAGSESRLRIVLRELNDTVELTLAGGLWVTEEGDCMEIESLISDGQTGMGGWVSALGARTRTARN